MKLNKCTLFSVFSFLVLSFGSSVLLSTPSSALSAYDDVIRVVNNVTTTRSGCSRDLTLNWFAVLQEKANTGDGIAQAMVAYINTHETGWAVSELDYRDGVNKDVVVHVFDTTSPLTFYTDGSFPLLQSTGQTYKATIYCTGENTFGFAMWSGSGSVVAETNYNADYYRFPKGVLFINHPITYPDGFAGPAVPSSYNPFTPPEFKLHFEVDNKHVKVTNRHPGIPDTPAGSPDVACSLKAIQAFDNFPTAYESNTTYCSTTFEFDVDTYGKYNIALKYWHFVGNRADGISADDYYYLGEATTSLFINGTKFSGGADSLGSTEICDSTGNCHPTDGSYSPCLAWGQPIIQTDISQPALINPISCFSDFGSFVNSLSFGVVNLGNFQVNPNQCRQLVVIDDWIHKPDITLCAKTPSYVRDVVTPIVTMVLSIFILTWLVNRGDRYGV